MPSPSEETGAGGHFNEESTVVMCFERWPACFPLISIVFNRRRWVSPFPIDAAWANMHLNKWPPCVVPPRFPLCLHSPVLSSSVAYAFMAQIRTQI